MMSRDQLLLSLRPTLDIIIQQQSEAEQFQTKTLRPILKFQNSIIMIIFHQWIEQQKISLTNNSDQQLRVKLSDWIKKNQPIKAELIGLVSGLMTESEYQFFCLHQKEVSKRLLTMTIERMVSQSRI